MVILAHDRRKIVRFDVTASHGRLAVASAN
jgi:hypothetical protein